MTDQDLTDMTTLESPDITRARADVITEAVRVIDGALAQMMQRELVSSGEVADLLLDVRMMLTSGD